MLRWLLEAGADPNREDKDGVLPIRLAHLAGRADTIALLRDYGAHEVELSEKERFFEAVFSNDGDRARALLRPALVAAFEEEDRLALNRSAEHGNIGAVRILLDCGFDISFKGARNWGSTPLHGAAWYGQAEIVELLLSRGSPIDIPANPPEESLPLGWAAHGSTNCRNPYGDYVRTVRALLAAGAEPLPGHADMASPEVAETFHAASAGRDE